MSAWSHRIFKVEGNGPACHWRQAQHGQWHQVTLNGGFLVVAFKNKKSYFDWFGFGEKFSGVGCLFPFPVTCHYRVRNLSDFHRDGLARRDFMVRTVCNSGYPDSVSITERQVKQTKKPRPDTCSHTWNNTYYVAVTNQGLYSSVCRLCSVRRCCVYLRSSSDAHAGPQELLSLLDSFFLSPDLEPDLWWSFPHTVFTVRNGLEKVIPLSSG